MEFTAQDLLAAGWKETAPLDSLLAEAARLSRQGNADRAYILKRLDRLHPRLEPTLSMRAEPIAFSEAVQARTREELRNLRSARRTMRELMACPVVTAGALLPDTCPAGSAVASIPVGGAVAVDRAIIPAAHGSDICCSMQATVFQVPSALSAVPFLLDQLASVTRFGPGGRAPSDWISHPITEIPVWDNPFLQGLQSYARMHLADQGDGNHFAFLGLLDGEEASLQRLRAAGHGETFAGIRPGERYHVLITHHGSRGLGARVFQRGQAAAVALTRRLAKDVPDAAAWLPIGSSEGRHYWDALHYLERWTRTNHRLIHERFLRQLGVAPRAAFGNAHNFVWRRGDLFLHGKGATPAWHDAQGRPLLGLIPLNMASPVLLVLGRDRSEFLSFAPHGAGRNQSRKAFIAQFRQRDGTLDEGGMERALAEATAGLEVRWFRGKPDLSESPLGYKPAETVRQQVADYDLAEIVAEVQPLGTIMAGRGRSREEELTPKQRRQIAHRSERRRDRQHLRTRRDGDGDGDGDGDDDP